MKYAIIGAGAVGGYYGGRLVAAGQDVHFLYHSEYEAVRSNGLRILSPHGEWRLRPPVYRDVRDMPVVDVVVVALKTVQTPLLPEMLPPLLGDGTSILCLQNGLGNEDALAAAFGTERIIAGSAFICAEREGPGVVRHYTEGRVRIGPFPDARGRDLGLVERIAAEFKAAGVPAGTAESGLAIKWGKLLWNVPFSGLSIHYGGVPTDAIVGVPERREMARQLMEEVIRAAASDGVAIDRKLVADNLASTDRMGAYKPSMLVDFEHGRPMEIEAILGEPLRRGEAAGLALPGMRAVYESALGRESQRPTP